MFKSVHFWGENPVGQWTLVFSDSTDVRPCKTNHSNAETKSVISNSTQTSMENNTDLNRNVTNLDESNQYLDFNKYN